jgi:predicted  nucleic acid-binding Zn-ribbon protein
MGWIETLTKEAFIAAIREAVKPDLEKLDGKIERLEGKIEKVKTELKGDIEALRGDIKGLEIRIGGLAERVSHLEGDLSGAIRAWEANWREHEARAEARDANQRSMLLEFQRNIEREVFTRLLEDKKRPAA